MSQTLFLYEPPSTAKSGSYEKRMKVWERTPNFKEVPKRDLRVQPYQDERWKMTQIARSASYRILSDGTMDVVSPAGYWGTGSDIDNLRNQYTNGFELAFESERSRAANDAEVKLLGKVADLKTNLGVMLAEARKTSDHILDTATRVYKAYRSFRKGNFREVARQLHVNPKQVHKTWLEYKYGWMPLLMDVKNSAEFFAQQQFYGGRPIRFQVDARYTTVFNRATTIDYAAWGGGDPAQYYQTLSWEWQGRLHLWIEVVNQSITQLQQLGVTNPALVAWELVPYSFVFDWFISVGDWLAALTAMQGLRVVDGFHSSGKTELYRYDQPATLRSEGKYYNSDLHVQVAIRDYRRRTYSPSGVPAIPYKSPDAFAKLVTSLALLRSNSRGLRV